MSAFLLRSDSSAPTLSLHEVREITASEMAELNESIIYCRRYSERYDVRLVHISKSTFDQALAKLSQPFPSQMVAVLNQEAEVALVTFLLMWRLFLDHSKHDLSQRFGKPSATFDQFIQKTSDVYDRYPGYRLIEGLRNYVQHVGLPGLQVTVSQSLEGDGSVIRNATAVLSTSTLLDWGKCPALLRADLEKFSATLPIVDLVQDAVCAFAELASELSAIDAPELRRHFARIQQIVDEVAPDTPLIAQESLEHIVLNGGSGEVTLIRFDDVLRFMYGATPGG
jgi:hypothetical protein